MIFLFFLQKRVQSNNLESNSFRKDVEHRRTNTIRLRMASVGTVDTSFDITVLDYEMIHVLAEDSSAGGLTLAATAPPF
jgi:hypothetical protein